MQSISVEFNLWLLKEITLAIKFVYSRSISNLISLDEWVQRNYPISSVWIITKTWAQNRVTLLKEGIVYVSKFIKHWSSHCDICVWRSSKRMFRHVKFYLHELVHCDVSVDTTAKRCIIMEIAWINKRVNDEALQASRNNQNSHDTI